MLRFGIQAPSLCRLGIAALLLAAGPASMKAGSLGKDRATVVVHRPKRITAVTLEAMRTEVRRQLASSHALSFVTHDQLALGRDVVRPVQVRFRGDCLMTSRAAKPASPGGYAWTHVSDGRVLPFVEVDCDRVRTSILSVMWGEDFQHRDLLLGRALGRVIAHELHHALERTLSHTSHGVTKSALRASELIRGTDPVAIGGL